MHAYLNYSYHLTFVLFMQACQPVNAFEVELHIGQRPFQLTRGKGQGVVGGTGLEANKREVEEEG